MPTQPKELILSLPAHRFFVSAGLILISLAVGLVLGEFLVASLAPQNLSGSWLEYGPRGLLLNKASHEARHQLGSQTAHYRFNSFHQRGSEPAPSRTRVLFLGDSFTFGWLLNDADTFSARLQKKADNELGQDAFQFLNAAVGGWGTSDQLAYLEAFGETLSPSLVVVFVSFDDANRSLSRGLYSLNSDGVLIDQDNSNSRSRMRILTERIPFYGWLLEHSHLAQLVRKIVVEHSSAGHINAPKRPDTVNGRDSAQERKMLDALFNRFSMWCEMHRAGLLVLTTGWPSVDYPWLEEDMKRRNIRFRDLASDVAPAVRSSPESFQIPNDMHPNEAGAELIANAAWPHIKAMLSNNSRK